MGDRLALILELALHPTYSVHVMSAPPANCVEETVGTIDIVRPIPNYIAPLFFKMAQNLDLRCVLVPAPWVLGPKHVSNPE